MRKVSIKLPSVILLILIFKVSSNTVTTKKELGSTTGSSMTGATFLPSLIIIF